MSVTSDSHASDDLQHEAPQRSAHSATDPLPPLGPSYTAMHAPPRLSQRFGTATSPRVVFAALASALKGPLTGHHAQHEEAGASGGGAEGSPSSRAPSPMHPDSPAHLRPQPSRSSAPAHALGATAGLLQQSLARISASSCRAGAGAGPGSGGAAGAGPGSGGGGLGAGGADPSRSPSMSGSVTPSCVATGEGPSFSAQPLVPLDENERVLSLQIALKAADLCNLCDPTDTHIQWIHRLEEEFFRQGDAERQLGLPITPLFDRTKPGVSKSQVAFMDIVAVPLFRSLASVFPGAEPLLRGLMSNHALWTEEDKKAAAAAAADAAAAAAAAAEAGDAGGESDSLAAATPTTTAAAAAMQPESGDGEAR